MDQLSQIPDPSSYVSAPTSPSGCNQDNMCFYSAPSSPIRSLRSVSFGYELETQKTNEGFNSDLGEFEFGTSWRFASGLELETSQRIECPMDDETKEEKDKRVERVDSFSTMAFADELFSNGKVLPLKLPPRLQFGNEKHGSQGSVPSSPRSPSSVLKIPFARRNTWDDDFDPFMVAMEKVRDEKGVRKSVHRRSLSLSPFRTTSQVSNISSEGWSQNQHKHDAILQPVQQIGPNPIVLVKSKGSVYSRWVRHQSMGHNKSSLHGMSKGFSFRRRSKSEKMGQGGPSKPNLTILPGPTMGTGGNVEQSEGASSVETRVQKMKGAIVRYASFGKENNEGKLKNQIASLWKPSYLKKFSFKFKGDSHGNGKKTVSEKPKMAVVQYRPKLTLCLVPGNLNCMAQ